MNRFLELGGEGTFISRAYARVDSVEPEHDYSGETRVYLEAVGATWFDEIYGEPLNETVESISVERMEEAPISIVGVWLSDLRAALASQAKEGVLSGEWIGIEQTASGAIGAVMISLRRTSCSSRRRSRR